MQDRTVTKGEIEFHQTLKFSQLPVVLKFTLNRFHDNEKVLRVSDERKLAMLYVLLNFK